jgi:hypothetical protein
MALLSLGETKWRMLRRVLRKKRFTFDNCRNQTRFDQAHFEWLVENGFVIRVGDDTHEMTDKGKAAADLGFYEV